MSIMATDIICNIGDAKIGRGDSILRATLGSCIGIGLIWRNQGRCALAHCLLAEAPIQTFEIGAKYVSQAIPSLLRLLKIEKASYWELETVVTGGAQMLGLES